MPSHTPVKQRMKKAFLENHFFHRIQPTHAVQNFEGCQLWVQLSQTFLPEFSHLNGFKGSCRRKNKKSEIRK